jgi:hypothetical protein
MFLPSDTIGQLFVGDNAQRGWLWGTLRPNHAGEPWHILDIPGAGMHRVPILPPGELAVAEASAEPIPADRAERWSRTIGALGGTDIWQRLTELPIAVIGCGRAGSLVATHLARLGVQRLTIIDDDLVERHNLGEMDGVSEAMIGCAKVAAVADSLYEIVSPVRPHIQPVFASIRQPQAQLHARSTAVIFCCVDNDAARLTTAILATLHHCVLIDIGSGIAFPAPQRPVPATGSPSPPERTMAATVRMILPGDGCLLCRGGLADYAGALDALWRPGAHAAVPWHEQRAGSLRSLNQLAATLAVQLLQDLVAERRTSSTWVQPTFDSAGLLRCEYPNPPLPGTSCSLCRRAGMGEAGLIG